MDVGEALSAYKLERNDPFEGVDQESAPKILGLPSHYHHDEIRNKRELWQQLLGRTAPAYPWTQFGATGNGTTAKPQVPW